MCLFKTPKVAKQEQPTKEVAVSNEDAINTQLEQEKKRRGFASTIATSGQGVTGQANVKKTQLGT